MISLTDEEISKRRDLAIEIGLTGGALVLDDLTFDDADGIEAVDPNIMRSFAMLIVNVIVGGVDGATGGAMADAYLTDPRVATAARESVWIAVAQLIGSHPDAESRSEAARRKGGTA